MSDWTPERIQGLRERMGMTQAQFADAVGGGRIATVSDWERGKKAPSRLSRMQMEKLEKTNPLTTSQA